MAELTDAKLDEMEMFARTASNLLAIGLVADLRASRAREAELAAEIRVMEIAVEAKRRKADEDFDARLCAEAERDVLQQRIDKALAICHEMNPLPHLNGDQFAKIRAALSWVADC